MNKIKNKLINYLPLFLVVIWSGCEDLDFPDPNNPTAETATIQSLVTGAEAQLRSGFGVYMRDLLVVGREAYYLEPADPRYTGELLRGPVDGGGFLCYTPWSANYKVISNCQTILNSPDADDGAKGFAQTLNAYALMRVLNLTAETGARSNYDGDISAEVATKDEVPIPYSSAPIIAAITMSRPVFNPPSVLKVTLCLKLFNVRIWFASVKPISHGIPAYLILV